ncbi:hypothetical protein SDC9_203568 [bioreactor metagenome]|uniref:Uncharacterized protein n=1 Tax=bioreactor metagenome TaxID=1076179 RepID=A0A645J5Y2_9ZZZZ
MATGRVLVFLPLRMMPNMKLFQEKTKERMAEVTMPGPEMGRMIFRKLLKRVLPSTAADSSSSLGRDSKNGTMIQMMKGRATTMWARMRPKWVSTMPMKVKMTNQGTRKVIAGIILTTSSNRLVFFMPKRAMP